MEFEPSTSLLENKDIRKYIESKYKPITYIVKIQNREEVEIYIEVENEKKGFKVTTPIRFREDDLKDIAEHILKEKDISAFDFRSEIKVESGDTKEHMDYGTSVFTGMRFKWDKDDVEEDIVETKKRCQD